MRRMLSIQLVLKDASTQKEKGTKELRYESEQFLRAVNADDTHVPAIHLSKIVQAQSICSSGY